MQFILTIEFRAFKAEILINLNKATVIMCVRFLPDNGIDVWPGKMLCIFVCVVIFNIECLLRKNVYIV